MPFAVTLAPNQSGQAPAGVHPQPGFPPRYVRTEETCGAIRPPNRPAPQEKRVAQGSLSSLAAFRPRRGFDGAGQGKFRLPCLRSQRRGTAGRAAGPDRRPCATSATPPTQRARRGFLHTNKGSQNASSWRCRVGAEEMGGGTRPPNKPAPRTTSDGQFSPDFRHQPYGSGTGYLPGILAMRECSVTRQCPSPRKTETRVTKLALPARTPGPIAGGIVGSGPNVRRCQRQELPYDARSAV
jgi:hypothetical protein